MCTLAGKKTRNKIKLELIFSGIDLDIDPTENSMDIRCVRYRLYCVVLSKGTDKEFLFFSLLN